MRSVEEYQESIRARGEDRESHGCARLAPAGERRSQLTERYNDDKTHCLLHFGVPVGAGASDREWAGGRLWLFRVSSNTNSRLSPRGHSEQGDTAVPPCDKGRWNYRNGKRACVDKHARFRRKDLPGVRRGSTAPQPGPFDRGGGCCDSVDFYPTFRHHI